jgi:hypothetical protein
MAWIPNLSYAQSKQRLGCFLHLVQSGALDHGLTVGTGANVPNLRDVSNCGLGQYARRRTLTPTNFSMYC